MPAFDTPAPPAPPRRDWPGPPFPPRIAPLLVRVVIVPAFDTPAPPAPSTPGAAAASAADLAAVGQRRDRPGVRHARAARRRRRARLPPSPPLIVPLLVSVLIVPEFDTPAPPVPPTRCRGWPMPPPPFPPLIEPLLVRVADRPAIRHARAARADAAKSRGAAVSAADRAAVGQRRDRAGIPDPRAAHAASEAPSRRFRRRSSRPPRC